MPKLLYSREEARDTLGYKRRAFDYLLASGELPPIHHGTRVFITARALEEFASKGDRPRMTPDAATRVFEPPAPPPLSEREDSVASQAGPADSSERERLLFRRRRRSSEGS
jgi:hypothetical protein